MSAVLIFMFFIGLLVVSLGGGTYAVKTGMKPAKAVAMQRIRQRPTRNGILLQWL